MVSEVWAAPVHVPLLQWLVRGSLKQNLPQAGRLWVWLHLLYGEQPLPLPHVFTYADCREVLFTETHPKGDQTPANHDPDCLCQKSLAAWLFSPQRSDTSAHWSAYRSQATDAIATFQTDLAQAGELPGSAQGKLNDLLHQNAPFKVSRRTLSSDLKRLHDLGWLRQKEDGYQKVTDWPDYPRAPAINEAAFLHPDLAEIATNLSQGMGEQQRFFVHTDYVVPKDSHDRVGDWQDKLRSLWQTTSQQTTPPLRLTYWSASRLERCEIVVYPVCIYYYRRGPYLCGWGQVPGEVALLDWRNYRLDKIEAMAPLGWQDEAVPNALKQKHILHQLPHPDEIHERMDQAWGFDYYQSQKELLVRFDAEWNERYIRNSLRHSTFRRVSDSEARSLIQTTLSSAQSAQLLAALSTRPQNSAYYRACYRHNDPNVRQRLRAWRPHIEVVLPWGLRQRFAQEVAAEQQFYQ